jgi:(p)ppGpp synthase/HD superfamily hydrolase
MPSTFRGLPKTQAALEYATRVHIGQRRKADGAPFIAHPLEVASLLYYAGAPDYLIAAGALHDTIEKTDTDASELSKRFGTRVARLVVAVSEDRRTPVYAQRKAALPNQAAAAGEDALLLFAADKVSKARELRLHPAAAPRWRHRRLTNYRNCLCLLQERLPDSLLVRELEMELEALSHGEISEPAVAGAR